MSEIILYEAGSVDVRIKRAAFKGSERVDIRIWADIAGARRPTKKGVSVPLERVQALIDALRVVAGGEQ